MFPKINALLRSDIKTGRMISAIKTSVAGLLSASNDARLAAERVVRGSARTSGPPEASVATNGARAYNNALNNQGPNNQGGTGNGAGMPLNAPFVGQPDGPGYGAPDPDQDMIRGMVDLTLAKHAYKANATALRAADEALGSLLDDKS